MKTCPQCGNQCIDQAVQCPKCKATLAQTPPAQQPQYQQPVYQQPVIVQQQQGSYQACPRCGSHNISFQAVAEQKKRGCLMSCLWILLAIFTLGAIIWIPLLTKKGSKTRTYAVCQNCGHRWKA